MCWEKTGNLEERNWRMQQWARALHKDFLHVLSSLRREQVIRIIETSTEPTLPVYCLLTEKPRSKETEPLLKVIRPHLAGTEREVTFVEPVL